MKNLVFLALVFVSFPSLADCSDKILEYYLADSLPMENQNCIKAKPIFVEGLVGLCNEARTDYSEEYKAYLDYKGQYQEKIIERDSAMSESGKRAFNMALESIRQDWILFGYKYELEFYVASVEGAIFSKCP